MASSLYLALAMVSLLAATCFAQPVPSTQPTSVPLSKWSQPLAKPGVNVPVCREGGVDRYAVIFNSFTQQLHPALPPTKVYGYDGSYPGATFEATVNRPVEVLWTNDLPLRHIVPTEPLEGSETPPESGGVVHLHGGHTPADSDGNPLDYIVKGEQQDFRYPNRQRPTTLWYHDHIWTRTRANVYAGLAGFYLLRDKDEAELGLPSGNYEIPIAIQDRVLLEDGQLWYPYQWQPEFFGDVAVVNGRVWPFLDVKPRAYRFRLLNGCNSRFLNLSIPGGPKFQQIGTDGGFLNKAVPLDSLLLGNGERADVIVDFYGFAGRELILHNNAATPFPGNAAGIELPELIKFRVSHKGGAKHPYKVPCLRKAADLSEDPFDLGYPYRIAKERDMTLVEINSTDPAGNPIVIPTLNGLPFLAPPTETPFLNTVELWRLINLTPDTHPIHLHLTQFRLIERRPFDVAAYNANGSIIYTGPPMPPPANENGFKDTIRANPGEVTTILVPFEDYTGNYVWHCHILEHEDNDMMRPLIILPRPH